MVLGGHDLDGAWFVLLAWLLVEELGWSVAALGGFLALGALGGLVGAAVADRSPNLSLSRVASVAFVAMAVPLAALSLFPNTVVVVVALVITSGGFSMWNVFMVSARQRASTPQTLGRISAAYRTVVVTSALVGTLIGGLVTELFSIKATFAAAAVAVTVATPAVVSRFRQDGVAPN